jgi:hypothetical protein
MEITKISKYSYKGEEYKSLSDIKEVIHNTIGLEVLDKINRVCPPAKHKDFIKMLDILCEPEIRKILIECYTVTFLNYDDFEESSEIINVLDI